MPLSPHQPKVLDLLGAEHSRVEAELCQQHFGFLAEELTADDMPWRAGFLENDDSCAMARKFQSERGARKPAAHRDHVCRSRWSAPLAHTVLASWMRRTDKAWFSRRIL